MVFNCCLPHVIRKKEVVTSAAFQETECSSDSYFVLDRVSGMTAGKMASN